MKKKIFNTVVSFDYHDYRVDRFLQSQLKELSRTRIQNLISDGQVKLNNITIVNSSKKIKKKRSNKSQFSSAKRNSY